MDSTSGSSNENRDKFNSRKRSRDTSGGQVTASNPSGVVPPGGISLQDAPVILVDDKPIQQQPEQSVKAVDTMVGTTVDTTVDIKPQKPTTTLTTAPHHKNRFAGPRTSSLPSTAMRDTLAAKLAEDSQPNTTHNVPSNIPIVNDTQLTKPTTTETHLALKPPSPTRSTSIGRKSTWSRLFRTDDGNKMKRNKAEPVVKAPEISEELPTEALSPSPPTTRSPSPIPSESIMSASGRKFGSLSSLFSRGSVRPAGSKVENSPKATTKVTLAKKTSPLPKRLPIHVERAVYRLSHIKLANPRRPLQHQVLISNFMFWYLSIVDAGNHHAGHPQQQQAAEADNSVDKKGKTINKFVAASKKRRQEIIQNKQRKAQLVHERMGGRRSETVIPAIQYEKQVRHHPLPHVGPRKPLMTPQQYIGTASAPTGFVVPQQYLHPATKDSSEGESDEDEDDDEEEEEDEDDDDDEEDDNVQWPLPPRIATQEKSPQPSLELNQSDLGTFGSELIDMINFDEEEDDLPLALYRKSH